MPIRLPSKPARDSSCPTPHRPVRRSLAFLAAALLLSACAPRALSTRGSVTLLEAGPDSAIAAEAASLPGLDLRELPLKGSWRAQLESRTGASDLILIDWDRDLESAGRAGLVAELSGYWARLSSTGRMRKALDPRLYGPGGKARYFLPLCVYPWGLFYNQGLLAKAGIAPPSTMAELEADFGKLSARGIVPVALGASYGWPALAWVSILDLRLNGSEAHRLLLEGRRAFGDPGLLNVYAVLERWRDLGWFSADASKLSWDQAMTAVDSGRAAFTFLSSSALTRYRHLSVMGFMALPRGEGGGRGGELGTLRGFVLPARASSPRAALALADAYALSGAPGQTQASWGLPAVAPSDGSEAEGLRGAAAKIVAGAEVMMPQLDWALPAQASMEARLAMQRFFDRRGGMGAKELAAALVKAASQ